MTTDTPKVFIYVQHLLGTGHVMRAAAIGRALVAQGAAVKMICGNTLPPTLDTSGLEVITLPPVRARDAHFKELLGESGEPIDDAWRANRRALLLEAFEAAQPDIVLTETYPFGRRQLAFELEPLMEAAWARADRPLIASSVRDILVPKADPRKEEAMAEVAKRFFDVVLVHSDPDVVRLDDSFPYADRVADRLHYTGFVYLAKRADPPAGVGDDEVIVSCGGGIGATHLLETAMQAREKSKLAADATWRLLVGHHLPDADFQSLQATQPAGVIVERARPDFPGLLKRARLSISQAGYNTVLDVLAAEIPSVLVPFAQVEESEQTDRALALAQRGRAVYANEKTLTPEILAASVDEAMTLQNDQHETQMQGAEQSAEILLREWRQRQ